MTKEEAIAILIHEIDGDIFVKTEYRKRIHEALTMGIKALKQKPCEDAIDRKLVCAFIDGLISDDGEREKGLEYIRYMPSATPQYTNAEIQKMQELEQAEIEKAYELGKASQPKTGHWIPISEELPDLDDYTGPRVWQKKVLITGYLSFDDIKNLFVSEAFAKDVICNSVHDTVIIAWMPLPLPYKAESEVEE